MNNNDKNNNLWIISIVAIVAIVGIVFMITENNNEKYVSPQAEYIDENGMVYSDDDLVGQAGGYLQGPAGSHPPPYVDPLKDAPPTN